MDKSQQDAYRDKLQANKHELYCLSLEEFNEITETNLNNSGKRNAWLSWTQLKDKLQFVASYTSTAKDLTTLAKVFADLGYAGTKAYIKYYKGKPYVIFKGNAGLRTIFNGTRYSLNNTKIVQMAIGRTGAIQSAKMGGVLTIILLSGIRIADYLLNDEATLNRLIGTLATDVVKVGIATGASIVAATAVAAVTTVAIGPIVAAIGIGVLVSYGLDKLDNHYNLTEKLISALDETQANIQNQVERVKQNAIDAVGDAVDSVIDYAIDETRRLVIDWGKHMLRRLIPSGPRL